MIILFFQHFLTNALLLNDDLSGGGRNFVFWIVTGLCCSAFSGEEGKAFVDLFLKEKDILVCVSIFGADIPVEKILCLL